MADYEVVAVRPAPARPATPATPDDRYEVGEVRTARRYRGARGNRGVAPIGTDAPGRSASNPIPFGQGVPVGAYGVDGRGAIVLRTRTGWNVVKPAPARAARPGVVRSFAQGGQDSIAGTSGQFGGIINPGEVAGNALAFAADSTDQIANLISGAIGRPTTAPTGNPISGSNFLASADRAVQGQRRVGLNVTPQTAGERFAYTAGAAAPFAFTPAGATRAGLMGAAGGAVGTWGGGEIANAIGADQDTTNLLALGGGLLGGGIGAAGGRQPAGNPLAKPTPQPQVRQRQGRPATRREQAAALKAEGVDVTPGQRYGGLIGAIEDKATSIPILGDAIIGARGRGREQLNVAVANRALAPIGEKLPANVRPGTDAVDYVQRRIGAAYDEAAALIPPTAADDALTSGLARLQRDAVDLTPADASRLANIISERLTSRFADGPLDGAALKDIDSQIGGLASQYSGSTDGASRALGARLAEVQTEMRGLIARSSPEAAAQQARADRAWANFVRMQDAASRTSTDDGVFTPQGLKAAVRGQDSTVRKGATASGNALLYDLADNAASVMNNKTPNSGTSDRAAMGALAVSAVTTPVGIPTALGLTVAATPYFLMARRITTAATRPGASPGRMKAAVIRLRALAKKDPAVRPLLDEVLAAMAKAGTTARQPTDQTTLEP